MDQDLLQGIDYHRQLKLKPAIHHFKNAAYNVDLIAIYFFSIYAREGFGCVKNPKIAFQILELSIYFVSYILEQSTEPDLTLFEVNSLRLRNLINTVKLYPDIKTSNQIDTRIKTSKVSNSPRNNFLPMSSEEKVPPTKTNDLFIKNAQESTANQDLLLELPLKSQDPSTTNIKIQEGRNISSISIESHHSIFFLQQSEIDDLVFAMPIYELAICHLHGYGCSKNIHLALYYFEIAANMGFEHAKEQLGVIYEHGFGVKRSKLKAANYYRSISPDRGQWFWKDKYSPRVVSDDFDLLRRLKNAPAIERNRWCCT